MEAGWNIAIIAIIAIILIIVIHLYRQFVTATKKNDEAAALVRICHTRNLEAMDMLLKAGTDPNSADAAGNTCLHLACIRACSKNVFQTLIKHGANVNATNSLKVNVFECACYFQHEEAIKVLLEAGANPGQGLYYAIMYDLNKAIIQSIIDHGVDVNATDGDSFTALTTACMLGNENVIKILLNSGADPNIADIHGITSLQYASCAHCSADTLQALTDHGAYINTTVDNSQTASRVAYFKEVTAAMKHAVENGINLRRTHPDLNIPDYGGNTPLHFAIIEGTCSKQFLQQLVRNGADVNATNMYNETALLHACNKRNTDAIFVLLNAGADPNIADHSGDTSLHMAAAAECSKETMQAIIAHGANVNAVNKSNCTALMTTSNYGHEDTTNVLLNAGADPNIADADGKTSLHHVIRGKYNKKVLQALIDNGADVNARDKMNRSAILCASLAGHKHAIHVLLNAGADPDIGD